MAFQSGTLAKQAFTTDAYNLDDDDVIVDGDQIIIGHTKEDQTDMKRMGKQQELMVSSCVMV
jgi:hypothetical protein